MRSKNNREADTSAARNLRALCEPELEEMITSLDCRARRELAGKFGRWAFELRFSADLIEHCGIEPALTAPVEIPDWALKQLQDAAALERIADEIRCGVIQQLGVIVTVQPYQALPVDRQN